VNLRRATRPKVLFHRRAIAARYIFANGQKPRPTAHDALSIVRRELLDGQAPTPNTGMDGLNVTVTMKCR